MSGSSRRKETGAFERWWAWLFGGSPKAKAHVSAPGIDVVIRGDPRSVHRLLRVVRQSLEDWSAEAARPMPARGSNVVQPRELDEQDSPYALPEAAQLNDDRLKEVAALRVPDTEPPSDHTAIDAPEGWFDRSDEATAGFVTEPSVVEPQTPVARERTERIRNEPTQSVPRARPSPPPPRRMSSPSGSK